MPSGRMALALNKLMKVDKVETNLVQDLNLTPWVYFQRWTRLKPKKKINNWKEKKKMLSIEFLVISMHAVKI